MKREKEQPLYMISVVARMLHVHPQTLRMYERQGFVHPTRTNKQRLYSESDVERIGMVLRLTREMGVNKAGVEIILRMRERIEGLQNEMLQMMEHLENEFRGDFEKRIRQMFSGEKSPRDEK
ncbi:MAG: MerR family transcriptional regulator [Nitrospiraceae bacterium]|nr:MerR family transcriptional regulator [Nitrospiraceae bacterium]